MLCAFNGYHFDFRVLLHHLREENIAHTHNFLLLDPWLDRAVFEKRFESLEQSYKALFTKATEKQKHGASQDAARLSKYYKTRAISNSSLTITIKCFEDLIYCNEPTRNI